MLLPPKFIRTEKQVNLIKEYKKIVIDENKNFIGDGTATGLNVPIFLYVLQQQTKKLWNPDYFKIHEVLYIKEDLMINNNAKIAFRKRTQRVAKQKTKKEKETISPKRIKLTKTSQWLTKESTDTGSGFEIQRKTGIRRRGKNWEYFDEWEKTAWVKI